MGRFSFPGNAVWCPGRKLFFLYLFSALSAHSAFLPDALVRTPRFAFFGVSTFSTPKILARCEHFECLQCDGERQGVSCSEAPASNSSGEMVVRVAGGSILTRPRAECRASTEFLATLFSPPLNRGFFRFAQATRLQETGDSICGWFHNRGRSSICLTSFRRISCRPWRRKWRRTA